MGNPKKKKGSRVTVPKCPRRTAQGGRQLGHLYTTAYHTDHGDHTHERRVCSWCGKKWNGRDPIGDET